MAVGVVTFWEISLKYGLGKFEMTGVTPEELPDFAEQMNLTLTLQKSRVLQIQGVKCAAVVIYRKPLTTLEMRRHRLSRRVNNMVVFH